MISHKMDVSYKVDEGYSEDTRSQDDYESPMRVEPGEDSILPTQLSCGASLQDAALALSEGERSGGLPRQPRLLQGRP